MKKLIYVAAALAVIAGFGGLYANQQTNFKTLCDTVSVMNQKTAELESELSSTAILMNQKVTELEEKISEEPTEEETNTSQKNAEATLLSNISDEISEKNKQFVTCFGDSIMAYVKDSNFATAKDCPLLKDFYFGHEVEVIGKKKSDVMFILYDGQKFVAVARENEYDTTKALQAVSEELDDKSVDVWIVSALDFPVPFTLWTPKENGGHVITFYSSDISWEETEDVFIGHVAIKPGAGTRIFSTDAAF